MFRTALAALLLVCGSAAAAEPVLIAGAGATFPYPLYSSWFSEYNKLRPGLRFDYQAIGSGGGIQQITDGAVDFGASDAPLTEEELARLPDAVHVPTVLGAVVITYNGPMASLRLTPQILSAIFLGKITSWNDPAIVAINGREKLPDQVITVVHRAEGSGTTNIFTDYLAKVSPEWRERVGFGKSVKWPVGIGGRGSEGVATLVKQTPGSIGYVELSFAKQNQLAVTTLRNRDGAWVTPSLEGASAAAASVELPADHRVSITDAPGKTAWPISSYTYILVHRDGKDAARSPALVQFLWWAVHQGQALAAPLDYAPLPAAVVAKVERTLQGLTARGDRIPLDAVQ
jgi:phosphate transport system substrate-binding protein